MRVARGTRRDRTDALVNAHAHASWMRSPIARIAPWHARCDWLMRHAITRGNWRIEMSFVAYLQSFARNDEGQDLLEYALLVSLIAILAVGAVGAAGTSVKTIFNSIATTLVPAS
jgi:Flp pilus assembly pilin Flp